MDTIGLIAGPEPVAAVALKAALIARDPSVRVLSRTVENWSAAPDAARKIAVLEACDALAEEGAAVIAFAATAAHGFRAELAAELAPTLLFPESEEELTEAGLEGFAERVLAARGGTRRLPFKVGLIGGLGPAATVDLYDKITRLTPAARDQDHLRLVVEQNPQVPDRTVALLGGGADPTLALYRCAKSLVRAGCEALAVPCNTAHAFLPQALRDLPIRLLDMQRATIDEIVAEHGAAVRVGLLATSGTIASGLFSAQAERVGLSLAVPDEPREELVMAAIYGPRGVKAGYTDGECREQLLTAVDWLIAERGCRVLILGCTELPLLLSEGPLRRPAGEARVVDATSALARLVVRVATEANRERGYGA